MAEKEYNYLIFLTPEVWDDKKIFMGFLETQFNYIKEEIPFTPNKMEIKLIELS